MCISLVSDLNMISKLRITQPGYVGLLSRQETETIDNYIKRLLGMDIKLGMRVVDISLGNIV